MKDQVTIFNSPLFGDIRTSVTESGEPLFCLADVCKALNLTTTKVATRLEKDVLSKHPLLTEGGVQQASFVNEDGLYDVILDSRKPEAKTFRKWVTSEVLPSIRKNGGYMTAKPNETPEQVMARALLMAKDTIDRQQTALAKAENDNRELRRDNETLNSQNEEQRTTIRQLQPGAMFAKAVESSENSILIGELAKILRQNGVDTGQNRMFNWMRRNGYLCRRGEKYNQPTQKALDDGLLEIKKTVIQKADGKTLVITTPKVTGRGQVFFTGKFLPYTFNTKQETSIMEEANV